MKMKMKIIMHMKMNMKIVMMLTTTECRPLSTPMSLQKHMKLCVLRAGSQHTCRIQDQDFNVVLQVCCLNVFIYFVMFLAIMHTLGPAQTQKQCTQ